MVRTLNRDLRRSKIFLPALRNRAEGGERLCGRPCGVSGRRDHMGIEEELVRMRAYEALAGALSVAPGVARPDANVMPVAYNPDRGKRVQLAWQRYSNAQLRAAQPCARPAEPAWPARPAACR